MSGGACGVELEAMEFGKQPFYGLVLAQVAAVVAPAGNDQFSRGGHFQQPLFVIRSDRFAGFSKIHWTCGAVGEQVSNQHTAAIPALCKSDATPDGGIILFVIGGGRVESDEEDFTRAQAPVSQQAVTIAFIP